jgi:substrate import-associated zinc metallohydrolase lipoprotein
MSNVLKKEFMKTRYYSLLLIGSLLLGVSCYEKEEINVQQKPYVTATDTLDLFIRDNFLKPYGMAVRYKYVDRYVDQTKRVTPPSRSSIKPMLNFVEDMWIDPFLQVPNGKKFFMNYVPPEVVLIGSRMYNNDGTVTLGTADAGARITLTEVDFIDVTNQAWVFQQIHTMYHEFAHIVHQRHNLPPSWNTISPAGYTSAGSWYNLTDAEALQRGFVSPYATSSFNEDFAETVAFLLYDPDFYEKYIDDEPNCTTVACVNRNAGRAMLRKKYTAVIEHYKQYVGVDLLQVRAVVQQKLQ